MKRLYNYLIVVLLAFNVLCVKGEPLCTIDNESGSVKKALFPVKGFSINSPSVAEIDSFCEFVDNELAPLGVNLLLLRINYSFDFKSVQHVGSPNGFTRESVKKLEAVCQRNNIKLVPHLELFGHQSGTEPEFNPNTLLKNYPQFDESYQLPKSVNFGYRSYCPLHPDIHSMLFAMMGEMADSFSSKDFHIGCDEVMTLGVCERCKEFLNNGGTNADLFANEINLLNNYLSSKGCRTWIWGDRLIDMNDAPKMGVNSLSEWEASGNGTAPAIDKIDKQILICDWHYRDSPRSHIYFAENGFDVISCFYKFEEAANKMLDNLFEVYNNDKYLPIRNKCLGIMGTNWGSSVTAFIEEFAKVKAGTNTSRNTGAYVFYTLFNKMKSLEENK